MKKRHNSNIKNTQRVNGQKPADLLELAVEIMTAANLPAQHRGVAEETEALVEATLDSAATLSRQICILGVLPLVVALQGGVEDAKRLLNGDYRNFLTQFRMDYEELMRAEKALIDRAQEFIKKEAA